MCFTGFSLEDFGWDQEEPKKRCKNKGKNIGQDDAIASDREAISPNDQRRKPAVAISCGKTMSTQDELHQDGDNKDDTGFVTVARKKRPRARKETQKQVNVSLIVFVV